MKRIFVISMVVFFFAGLMSQAQTFTIHNTMWANRQRTYGVYVPREVPVNPALLIYLHATYPGSATPWQGISQWKEWANTEKFIAVWPLATYVPRMNSSYWAANDVAFTFPSDPDDIGWLCSLIPRLAAQYNASSVYVTGMSSGAMMTQRVGMTCPQHLAAIAPVDAQIYVKQMTDSWQPPTSIASPLSVLEIHGDADTDLQYCGQTPHTQWDASFMSLASVDQDMQFWTRVNGLPLPSVSLCTNGLPTRGVTNFDEIGPNGIEVKFIDNVGGTHTWPRWAYQTVWQFFAEHPKR